MRACGRGANFGRHQDRRSLENGHRSERRTPEKSPENWGHWIYVFDRGRFAITQENEEACTWGYGKFAVDGSRMSWTFTDGGGIAPKRGYEQAG